MRLFLILCLVGFSACQKSPHVPVNQVISYHLQGHQYVILVVEDHGVTEEMARDAALRKAAQITLDRHFRYFSILSNETVQVAKGTDSSTPHLSEELYQEIVEQEEFGIQSEENESVSKQTYPAIRLVIECYVENPESSSYNARQVLKN